MLKLLKHDLKDSYLEILIINGAMVFFTLTNFIFLKLELQRLWIVSIYGWVFSLASSAFVILNSIVKGFHSKLFTDFGYLTLTTPVSIDKILLSKIIVNMIWITGTTTCAILCLALGLSSFEVNFIEGIATYILYYPIETLQFIVSGLVSALSLICTLIFTQSIINSGNKRHKLTKGLLIYMAIVITISAINPFTSRDSIFYSIFGWTNGHILNQTLDYFLNIAFYLGLCTAFYFLSRYIIKNHLELE